MTPAFVFFYLIAPVIGQSQPLILCSVEGTIHTAIYGEEGVIERQRLNAEKLRSQATVLRLRRAAGRID